MKVRKIGVLGCGMIAEHGHIPALKQVNGLSLHAVYDVAWNRALTMQARFVHCGSIIFGICTANGNGTRTETASAVRCECEIVA